MPIFPASPTTIDDAARVIRAGGLVAFPTETVYGLGGDATNSEAVAAIFEAKGRPSFNPLIVHVADLAAAQLFGTFSKDACRLAGSFWPGPLTLVVERRAGCPIADLASAGLNTLALRVPDHRVAKGLLRAAGCPIAAPSANRSGHVSPTTARHVDEDLGDRVAMILDGGATEHGLESTVVDASGRELVLLRPGAITAEQIAATLGHAVKRAAECAEAPLSPGQLASHYAPRARLRLDASEAREGGSFVGVRAGGAVTRVRDQPQSGGQSSGSGGCAFCGTEGVRRGGIGGGGRHANPRDGFRRCHQRSLAAGGCAATVIECDACRALI